MLDRVPDPHTERGNFLEKGTLCGHLCENSRTDHDAVWIVGSVCLKES